MSIREISVDKVRRMEDQEGLVIQGCGGDMQEWVDGINEMLTQEGILKKGTKFGDVYSFHRGELPDYDMGYTEAVNLISGSVEKIKETPRCGKRIAPW